jgi:hypothetical protein
MSGNAEAVPAPPLAPADGSGPVASSAPSAPALAPPPAPISPPPAARKRHLFLVIGAVLVVAVLLLAALTLGLFGGKPASSSSGPMGTAIDYDAAFARAGPEALTAPGGPWTIVGAEGVATTSGFSGANAGTFIGGACTVTPATGAPAVLTFLGTPSNATSGEAAQWFFFSTSASGSVVLMIGVNASAAVPVDYGTGGSCLSTFGALAPINGSVEIDSIVAVQTFDSDGGASWAQNHTVLTRTFVLVGTSSDGGLFLWDVSYSTCSLFVTSGSGLVYSQAIDASTASGVSGPSQTQTSC